tara:strand:- start:195 stop:461 length:267 start_codon:yes stop_codon:yes gene_type:complete
MRGILKMFVTCHLCSSAIRQLNVDEDNGIAQVEFINGRKYTYFDVAIDAITELLDTKDSQFSVGKWVNKNLLRTKKEFKPGWPVINYD